MFALFYDWAKDGHSSTLVGVGSSARVTAIPAHAVPWIQPTTNTRTPCGSPTRIATIERLARFREQEDCPAN